jgi:hypothetical protein
MVQYSNKEIYIIQDFILELIENKINASYPEIMFFIGSM